MWGGTRHLKGRRHAGSGYEPRVRLARLALLGLLLLTLGLVAAVGGTLAAAPAQLNAPLPDMQGGRPGPEGGHKLGEGVNRPATPLENLLNADGTLNLPGGFSSSVDPTGWRMDTDPSGQPRFVRVE